jgi:hypothetical protein
MFRSSKTEKLMEMVVMVGIMNITGITLAPAKAMNKILTDNVVIRIGRKMV